MKKIKWKGMEKKKTTENKIKFARGERVNIPYL